MNDRPLRCAIVDDEPFALDLLRDYIQRTPFLELAGSFSNPFKALAFLNSAQVDLLFLDINMPELTGIQLVRSLVRPPAVVFTTAYPEYGAESYEYNAVDYLLKPVTYDRFLKAVGKASLLAGRSEPSPAPAMPDQAAASSPTEELLIKSGTQLLRVQPDEILYVEADGNYMVFHTVRKKFLSLMTMAEALALLPGDRFLRIHKSYIVGLQHITAIESHDLLLDARRLPIGLTYLESVRRRLSAPRSTLSSPRKRGPR